MESTGTNPDQEAARLHSVLRISPEQVGDGVQNTSETAVTTTTQTQRLSDLKIHQFQTQIMDSAYYFQVTNFGKSIYLWIGDGEGRMTDLVMASITPYDKKGMPTSTKIIGQTGDNLSESLASKLTKRLQKPVYVSFNVSVGVMFTTLLQDIEQRLYEEIALCPDKF